MEKATIANIAALLNKTLRVRGISDASVNGLQVRSSRHGTIHTVGFAVDACSTTFEKARSRDIDLLVVHHGIKWKPQKDRYLARERAAYLEKNNIALYAAHLPLDLHTEYGNNIQLSRMLGVQHPRKFGRYHGIKIGYAGSFANEMTLGNITSILRRRLKAPCRVLRFGKNTVGSIGIISGGGGSMLAEAVREQLDCFLVGEIDLAVFNAARDYGMNIVVAGHYATETVGVKALMPLVRNAFAVETVFIHDPKDA